MQNLIAGLWLAVGTIGAFSVVATLLVRELRLPCKDWGLVLFLGLGLWIMAGLNLLVGSLIMLGISQLHP